MHEHRPYIDVGLHCRPTSISTQYLSIMDMDIYDVGLLAAISMLSSVAQLAAAGFLLIEKRSNNNQYLVFNDND